MTEERFPLVNEAGDVIGSALRSEVHGNPALMHPVVHCLVANDRGDLLLQLRSRTKDVQPGKWDTSVGGHIALGETVDEALGREMAEELGIDVAVAMPRFLYRYVNRSAIETELVHTYACTWNGPFRRQEEEIDELRFWSEEEIGAALGKGLFTPNFEDEWRRYRAFPRGS